MEVLIFWHIDRRNQVSDFKYSKETHGKENQNTYKAMMQIKDTGHLLKNKPKTINWEKKTPSPDIKKLFFAIYICFKYLQIWTIVNLDTIQNSLSKLHQKLYQFEILTLKYSQFLFVGPDYSNHFILYCCVVI